MTVDPKGESVTVDPKGEWPLVIVTGGGTAGHTNPGIAVAQALVAGGLPSSSVHFVGGERGNEREIVPAAGFSIDLLPGRGIRRAVSPSAVRDNIGAAVALVRGLIQAWQIVRRRRPAVVLCLGGYAAFGATLAAVVRRVPVVVSEQNARASAVNRLFGRVADRVALPYPDTDLPNGVVTGNPIRLPVIEAVATADRSAARCAFSVPDDRVFVAVWAGSLGATRINHAVADLARRWRDRNDVTLHHVVGRRDWDQFRSVQDELAGAPLDYRAVEYEDDMPALQVAADLAVCRSGASTTAELAVAGLPAILVPLPGAPRDHQRANSAELAAAGGAIVVNDATVNGAALEELLDPLVVDPGTRQRMADGAASVGRPGAAHDVAAILAAVGGFALPSIERPAPSPSGSATP